MSQSLRDDFLLDPDVVFLNHGSFGACPRPVFDVYQQWQHELERQPVAFFRRARELIGEACAVLGTYVGADPDDLVFVTNATFAINTVARSIPLQPGDEVLATDHEYGAIDRTWEFACAKAGAHYVRHPIPLPLESPERAVESIWSAVTPRTRVIALSHITSPTALVLPVEIICRRAREAGILTVIDGAHVPGQYPLDLRALGADFYAGNCHKWLCSPKGAGFLYARREYHAIIDPLVVSWGWGPDSTFVSRNLWQGTRDPAAFLSIPAAINYQRARDWDQVRRDCHALAVEARERIAELTGLPHLAPEDCFAQMFAVPLPPCDVSVLTSSMYDQFRVEVPGYDWNGRPLLRVSIQGYNARSDVDVLLDALAALLPRHDTDSSGDA